MSLGVGLIMVVSDGGVGDFFPGYDYGRKRDTWEDFVGVDI